MSESRNRLVVGQVAIAAIALTVCWAAAAIAVAVVAPGMWGGLALGAAAALMLATAVLAASLVVRFTGESIKPLLGKQVPWSDIAWVGLKRGPLGYTSIWIATAVGRSLADRELDQLGAFGRRDRVAALAQEIADRAGVASPAAETPPSSPGRRADE